MRSFTSRQKSWASLANMVIKHGTAATAKSNYTASSALNTANGSIASFIQVPTQNIGRGLTFSPTGQLLLHYGQVGVCGGGAAFFEVANSIWQMKRPHLASGIWRMASGVWRALGRE